jgi:tRNA U34 5-carboxymethylaminomethyl modifying GTPase MnmE/TrmE
MKIFDFLYLFSHIHGSKAVANAMYSILNSFPNYRLAEPGEFSKR